MVNRSRPHWLPELDQLVDSYYSTVPLPQRLDILGRIGHITTDQLVTIGLYDNPNRSAIAHRVVGASAEWPNAPIAWNAYAWDAVG